MISISTRPPNTPTIIGSAMTPGLLVVSWLLSLFHVATPFLFNSTPLSLGISLLAIGFTAFSLALNFDMIDAGVSQGVPKKQRFNVNFYLTAMLFILFDIEIVFLYPLAVILHQLAWFGFFEFLTFLIILLIAYVYIWRKGALEWR